MDCFFFEPIRKSDAKPPQLPTEQAAHNASSRTEDMFVFDFIRLNDMLKRLKCIEIGIFRMPAFESEEPRNQKALAPTGRIRTFRQKLPS